MSCDIAIVGLACRFPNADNQFTFWNNIVSGYDFIRDYPEKRKKDIKILHQILGLHNELNCHGSFFEDLCNFDYNYFNLTKKQSIQIDPATRLTLMILSDTLQDAGYNLIDIKGEKTGIYIGRRAGRQLYVEAVKQREHNFFDPFANYSMDIPKLLKSILDTKADITLVDTACSSSLVALHQAIIAICAREINQALVASINLNLFEDNDGEKLNIISSDNKTRAFDANMNGTSNSDGAVSVLLKPLDSAICDNDYIYSVILGSAINQDGKSFGITAPSSESQMKVIQNAWEQSGIDPEKIIYMETHGVATPLGDPIEIQSIKKAFSKYTDKRQFCSVGSLKTNMGHLNCAAGLASLVKVCLIMRYKTIPPHLHFNKPYRRINFINSPIYIADRKIQIELEDNWYCAVNSFGLSGTNCHVVLSPYFSQKTIIKKDECFFFLSARSYKALRILAMNMLSFLKHNKIDLYSICYTLYTRREYAPCRCGIVCCGLQDLIEQLSQYCQSKTINHNILFRSKNFLSKDASDECIERLKKYEDLVYNIDITHALLNLNFEEKIQNIVSLPSVPWEFERCWLKEEKVGPYYCIKWVPLKKLEKKNIKHGNVLVIIENNQIPYEYKLILKKQLGVILYLNFNDLKESDLHTLIIKCIIKNEIKHIIYISKSDENIYNGKNTVIQKLKNIFSLFKTIYTEGFIEKIKITLMTEKSYLINNDKINNPANMALTGFFKGARQESIHADITCLDYADIADFKLACEILTYNLTGMDLAVRNGVIYKESVIDKRIKIDKQMIIAPGDVVVVAGGLGGIGFEISKYFANFKASVIILGRSMVSNQKNMDKIDRINQLNKSGLTIEYYSCDISNYEMTEIVLSTIRKRYGHIDIVVNAAGLIGNGFIHNRKWEEFYSVLAPKIVGTWNLDQLTRQDNLKKMILFSSVCSFIQGAGQSDYIAANAYLDAYSNYRNAHGFKTLTINWTGWKEVGTAAESKITNGVFKLLPINLMLSGFTNMINGNEERVLYGEFNLESGELGNLDFRNSVSQKIFKYLQRNLKKQPRMYLNLKLEKTAVQNNKIINKDTLKEIWQSVLGTEITYNDNFFELGGNSIIAIRIIDKLKKEYHTNIQIKDFFNNASINMLYKFIMNQENIDDEEFILNKTENRLFYPVTPPQKRLFIFQKMSPNSIAYNLQLAFELLEDYDIKFIKSIYIRIFDIFDILRTGFIMHNNQIVQVINNITDIEIEYYECNDDLNAFIKKLNKPFNLSKPPLWKIFYIKYKDRHIILNVFHHILVDGKSIKILMDCFNLLYQGKNIEAPYRQYKDYAVWLQEKIEKGYFTNQRNYWIEQLKDIEDFSLTNKNNHIRPVVKKYNFSFLPDQSENIRKFSIKQNLMSFSVLLASFLIMLHRYSEKSDITIATVLDGRTHEELYNMVGMMANTVLIRSFLDSTDDVLGYLSKINNNLLAAYDNQNYPFEEIITDLKLNTTAYETLFKVLFTYQNWEDNAEIHESTGFTTVEINSVEPKVDLEFCYKEIKGQYIFEVIYDLSQYSIHFIEDIIDRFQKIVCWLISNADNFIEKLPEFTQEKHSILKDFEL